MLSTLVPRFPPAEYQALMNARTIEARAISWSLLLSTAVALFLALGGSASKSSTAARATAAKPARKMYGLCVTSR